MPLSSGTAFGPYEIRAALGAGGYDFGQHDGQLFISVTTRSSRSKACRFQR
jgi:hypothetical protein